MRRFPFSLDGAQLREERSHLLNSDLATVPARRALNFRRILTTNVNYADYSFLFTRTRASAKTGI